MSQPKRQHPRYAVDVAVELITREETVSGRCKNISRGGLCVLGPRPISPGVVATARIVLRFDTNSVSEPLNLPARVVWCTNLGDEHQLGAALLSLTDQQFAYLELFLRYIDEGDARRLTHGGPPAQTSSGEDPFDL